MADTINSCITKGEWPNIWKEEAVTPISKIHPPMEMEDPRNISGLKILTRFLRRSLKR